MVTRRTALGAGVALVATLAGCSYSSGPDANPTGERVRWRADLDEPPHGLFPAADLLLAPTPYVARGLSLDDGSEAWSRRLAEPEMGKRPRYGGPATADADRLYLGGVEGVLALAADDGSPAWGRSGSDSAVRGGERGPGGAIDLAAAGGRLFAATEGEVVALDATTGEERWRVPVAAPRGLVHVAATADAVAVTARTSRRVAVLDAGTGDERWSATVAGSDAELRPPAVAGDAVYLATGRPPADRGTLRAHGLTDGRERWRTDTDRVGRGTRPAVGPERVYVGCDGSETGSLVGHDRSDGTRRWTVTAEDDGVGQPTATARGAYVGGNDDRLRAVAPDGSVRWTVDTGATTMARPVVVDGTVHASALDTVFAVRA